MIRCHKYLKKQNPFIRQFTLIAALLNLILINASSAQWEQISYFRNTIISGMIITGDTSFVGSEHGFYRSFNNGLSWEHMIVDSLYPGISSLSYSHKNLYAATSRGVFLSTDQGSSWQPFGLQDYSIMTVFAFDSLVFACIHGGGLFRTDNGGEFWQPIDGNHFYTFLTSGKKIFAGTFTGIQVSTDMGLTWHFCGGYPYQSVSSLSKNDKYLFAASWHDMFISADNGISWDIITNGLPADEFGLTAVLADDSSLFAGHLTNKVYYSTDNGLHWSDISQGLPEAINTGIYFLTVHKDKLYAPCYSEGLWRRDISHLVSVKDSHIPVIQNFSLHQNYPNPFNPSTTIEYFLPKSGFVTLHIYNILGQLIMIPVNEYLPAGQHAVKLNGNALPAGIFFYQLKFDNNILTKKMIVQK